ncbi:S-adenosyl-L-methionine-dependent methyltransferase [Tricharina praecox]|uniref:S-adenosyl-L-methionine-dependent methyltransferase n=1 Tax=Tricharina praecox TaxID=43433 RepID=UPI0022200F33|nr:S-adenosyl-L-methionine-dependent methyltransferase [Tricharina praecox]KAI5843769.1 S-adenosyl-L-methionine-dependent methyltransferase [Tricharina praecox]
MMSSHPAAGHGHGNGHGNIEVDPIWDNDDDSTYESAGSGTSIGSITHSIHEYVFENGRRYHTYFGVDKYIIPTDEQERDRLDLNHEVLLQQLRGELHGAPAPKEPKRILDVGTGSGIWAIDMAEKYPDCEVLGIDLSPIQPNWVPPNCRFEIDDAEEEWIHVDNSFDFIHMRNLNQGISHWDHVLSEAYRCAKPGTYLELSESGQKFYSDDGSISGSSAMLSFTQKLGEAMLRIGRPPMSDGMQEAMLMRAGFVDIHSFTLKMVMGPWPKDARMKKIGIMNWAQSESAFQAYSMAALTRILGMSYEEADRICREALDETKNKSKHVYLKHYVAYGRKPAGDERNTRKRKAREESPDSGDSGDSGKGSTLRGVR